MLHAEQDPAQNNHVSDQYELPVPGELAEGGDAAPQKEQPTYCFNNSGNEFEAHGTSQQGSPHMEGRQTGKRMAFEAIRGREPFA